MVTSTTTVAAKANQARREQGVAILPLSEATGIPRTTLTRFLNNSEDISVSRLIKLAHELKVNPASWLDAPAETPAEVAA